MFCTLTKYLIYIGMFLLFISFILYCIFGHKFLTEVMHYPFSRTSQDFQFAGASSENPLNINQFSKQTKFTITHETQIQNITVDIDTNITGIPLFLRIYVSNSITGQIGDRGEDIQFSDGAGGVLNSNGMYNYKATLPLNQMSPLKPLNATKYVFYDIIAWGPEGNNGNAQLLISPASLQNTIQVNGPSWPAKVNVNLVSFTFVNGAVNKQEKIKEILGLILIVIFSSVGYFTFGKFLTENITIGSNKFGVEIINKIFSFAPFIIMGILFIWGLVVSGLMLSGAHITEQNEGILEFWSITSFIFGLYGIFVLIY